MYANLKDTLLSATGLVVAAPDTFIEIDLSAGARMIDQFAFQFKGVVAAPTALTVNVEISIDGTTWTSVGTYDEGDDAAVDFVVDILTQKIRVNVSALTLGVTCTGVNFYLLCT